MLILNREDMDHVFHMKDAIAAAKIAFSSQSTHLVEAPVRTKLAADDDKGVYLFMPGHVKEVDQTGIKIVSVFPNNHLIGKSNVLATMLLFSEETGEVVAMLDGTYLTQMRTGAASGAATDLLANQKVEKGALFGTGGQAEKQLEAMLVARQFKEVAIYSRNEQMRDHFCEKMQRQFGDLYEVKLTSAKTSDEAIEGADVISTATSSSNPVFNGSQVKKGAHINGVGSYTLDMQELDEHLITHCNKLYVDAYDSYLAEAGDIVVPMRKGLIDVMKVNGELGEVISGAIKGRENPSEITVFKSVGIAPQDIVTASMIYSNALEKGIGTKVKI